MKAFSKIKYTESGREKLEESKRNYESRIERILISRLSSPGNDTIEATAKDVELATRHFRVVNLKKIDRLKFVSGTYITTGIMILFVGLGIDYIRDLMSSDSPRAIIMLAGLTMTAMGVLSYLYTLFRTSERDSSTEIGTTDQRNKDT